MLGNTIHLPIVYQELSPKFEKIARMLVSEVDKVERIFDTQRKSMEEESMTHALIWSGKLRRRLTEHTQYMESLKVKLFNSELGHNATIRYSYILQAIEKWESNYIEAKTKEFLTDSDEIMNGPLLTFDENNRLIVNMQPKLDDIFQGINRMTMNEIQVEEESLVNLWNRRNELCELKMKLYRITEWYNYTQFEVNDQEKNLLEPNSDTINQMTADFLSTIKWNNYNNDALDDYVTALQQLYKRTKMAHDRVRTIADKMQTWCNEAMFKRCEATEEDHSNLLDIEDRAKIVADRYKMCAETQELIRTVMQENYCLLKDVHIMYGKDEMHVDQRAIWPLQINKDDKEVYLPYEEYIDGMICSNLMTAIETSLRYLHNEMQSSSPLFHICFSLDVENRMSIFQPSLNVDEKEGFVSFITTLMVDIFGMAVLLKRVPMSLSGQDYMSLIKANETIEELRLKILVLAKNVAKETLSVFEQYEKYSYIWAIDRNKYMDAFLKYGRQMTVEDLAKIEDGSFTEELHKPTNDAFETEIKRHRDFIPEIERIPEFIDTAPWFRVVTGRFKAKLVDECMKWTEMFKDYLHKHITLQLNELEHFVSDAKRLLANRCDTHELEKYRSMHNKMNEIDQKCKDVESMFDPLKVESKLLRKYGLEIEQNVKEQLIELPLWWKKLKKQKAAVRNEVEPVKLHQKNLTGKRIKLFEMRLKDFNKRFHNQRFFRRNCKNAYEIIDKMLEQILKYEQTAELLDIYATLFNIDVALSNTLIQELHKEIRVLKQVILLNAEMMFESEMNVHMKIIGNNRFGTIGIHCNIA